LVHSGQIIIKEDIIKGIKNVPAAFLGLLRKDLTLTDPHNFYA
jgi:NADPH-dependent curcumin reductase CurA